MFDLSPPPEPKKPAAPNQNSQGTEPPKMWPFFAALLLAFVSVWLLTETARTGALPGVDYSRFYSWVESGKVEAVTLRGEYVEATLKKPENLGEGSVTRFSTIRPKEDATLLPTLRERGVLLKVRSEQQSAGLQILVSMLPWVLILGFWIWFSRRAQAAQGGGPLGRILQSKGRKFEKSTNVEVTFDDVAGLQSAKRDLQEIVSFLEEPERFQRMGGKVPRGVLLVGPPGTGKTLLARAVAGESGVSFFSISASEFIEMFVGVGAARVRDLFSQARKEGPAIVFIDELDAVGRARGAGFGGGHDEREQTLNQLLSEMDGFDRNDLTIVLAATNRPDVLDPALLRPGRFDRRVVVDRPAKTARRAILDVHVKNKPLSDGVDLDVLARDTPGFSGADLANLVNEAALFAVRRHAEEITAQDFRKAYDKIVLGDPRETALSPDEKWRVAVHESGHAVVAQMSPDAEPLHRVTIIPRGLALGVTQQVPAEDRQLMTEPQLRARLRILMAGYSAEQLTFGNVSSGAKNDLKEATKIAVQMVAHYGMSEELGAVYYEHAAEHPFLGHRMGTDGGTSDTTTALIEATARKLLTRALGEAVQLLATHRESLNRLQEMLSEQETVEQQELEELFGPERVPESCSTLGTVRHASAVLL